AVAVGDQLGDLAPVDVLEVEAQGHPASLADVSGQVEAVWVGGDEATVPARGGLAEDGHPAVAPLVVDEPGEGAAADLEAEVAVVVGDGGLGGGGAQPHPTSRRRQHRCGPRRRARQWWACPPSPVPTARSSCSPSAPAASGCSGLCWTTRW